MESQSVPPLHWDTSKGVQVLPINSAWAQRLVAAGVKLSSKISRGVFIVVEPHYAGEFLGEIQNLACYKPSWLEECFAKKSFVQPTEKHQWMDKTFGGVQVTEMSPDYGDLPPGPKEIEQEIQKKRYGRSKATAATAVRPKPVFSKSAPQSTLSGPDMAVDANGAGEFGEEVNGQGEEGESMQVADHEGDTMGDLAEQMELDEQDLEDVQGIIQGGSRNQPGRRNARGAPRIQQAVAQGGVDADALVPIPAGNPHTAVEIPRLQREVFLRYGTTMAPWPEDEVVYRTGPRIKSGPTVSAPVASNRRGRPSFPDELLTSPRCEEVHARRTKFTPEEDAAILIWMARAWPLIGTKDGVTSFQSPCLWHWAQQLGLTSRSWETMKSRERLVLHAFFTGTLPVPDEIYVIIRDTPFFVYEGQRIIMYNRSAVERANLESLHFPGKQSLIDRLLEMPPAVPVRRKRTGLELYEISIEELSRAPLIQPQDTLEAAIPDPSAPFATSGADLLDEESPEDLGVEDILEEPTRAKRRKLKEED